MNSLSLTDRSIVEHLQTRPSATVQDVARHLGLALSTAVSALNRLADKGIVIRGEPIVYGRGRPIVPYRLRLAGNVMVIQMDGSQIAASLLAEDGAVLAEQSIDLIYLKNLKDALVLSKRLLAALLIDAKVQRTSLRYAVLAVNAMRMIDGPISSSVLPWASEQMIDRFAEALGVTIYLGNHGGLQAEWQCVEEPWPDAMLYLRAGDGVSCHAILMGQGFRGHNHLAGQLGHITVDPQGPMCGCGKRGCLETMCSGAAIVKTMLHHAKLARRTHLDIKHLQESPTRTAIEHIWQVWSRGDKVACQAMEPILDKLAWGLSMAANLYDPELIRAGGYVLEQHDRWLDHIAQRVKPYLIYGSRRNMRIEPAQSSRQQQHLVVALRAMDEHIKRAAAQGLQSA